VAFNVPKVQIVEKIKLAFIESLIQVRWKGGEKSV